MRNTQSGIISGNIWDTFLDTDQDVVFNRIPKLGTRVETWDGKEFVFVKTAVDIDVGEVIAAPIALAEIANGITAVAAGNTEIVITSATLDGTTADLYAGGTIVLVDGAASRISYGIVSNTVEAYDEDATDNMVKFTLDAPLAEALTATDDCIIVPPRYGSVILNTASAKPIGVAQTAVAPATDTDATYGYLWLQTKGVGGVLITTVASVGDDGSLLMPSTNTVVVSDGTLPPIGTLLALADVTDGDIAPVDLCIM